MHDLLILFSTLGGIAMFGIIGIIIGPIIAALFVTIWDIYGVVFKDVLPKIGRP
jgi:predicted PurR-regulated permease PerM